MSEPGSAPGFLRHGPDGQAATVHHATRDLSWTVWEVLGHWQHPGHSASLLVVQPGQPEQPRQPARNRAAADVDHAVTEPLFRLDEGA